jgi:NTE family protein
VLSPQAYQTLFASALLRDLPYHARGEAAALFEEVSVAQGTVLLQEGQPSDAFYILVTGAVDITIGDTRVLRLAPGESIGQTMTPDQPLMGSAIAALDCRLLVLRKPQWPRFEEIHPGIAREFARQVARRLEFTLARKQPRGCEFVVLRSETPWLAHREVIHQLAEALEREVGSPVAIATGCAADLVDSVRPVRDNGLDWVVGVDPSDPTGFRENVARELGERTGKLAFVLVEVHESAIDFRGGMVSDLLVQRVVGEDPPVASREAREVIFLHDQRDGAGPSLGAGDVVALPPESPARERGIERLARRICGRSIGVALGSGAAWGLSHIGVLEVLEEAGIPIDFIAGASMGAIVGAHYALGYGPSELHEMATRVKTLRDFVRILPELLYLAADFNLVQPGFFAGQHFKKLLASIAPIGDKTFADLELPFRAVATNIETGARAELFEGELAEAVHASFAAPGIFSPHRIGDGVYIDGGMVDPVPADTVRRMGADLVIAVNVVPPLDPRVRNPLDRGMAQLRRLNPLAALRSDEQERLPDAFDALMRTIQLMQYQLGNDRAGDADVLINPELTEFWILEFWAGEAMIRKGAEAAREALPEIHEKLASWRKESSVAEV